MIETKYSIDKIQHIYCLTNKGENEIWKLIPNYPYALSSYGRVINMNSGKFIKTFKDTTKDNDILCFGLNKSSSSCKRYLHLAIGMIFLDLKPNYKYELSFIDGDTTNYFYKNLQFKSVKKGKIISYETSIKNKKDSEELNTYLDYIISLHREEPLYI